MRWMWLVALVMGCSAGEGPDSKARGRETGEDTTPAPIAGVGPALVWVDARGVEMPGVVTLPEGLAYVDPDGNFWRVTAGTAAFSGFANITTPSGFYSDSSCTDEWIPYDLPIPPRYVLRELDADRYFVLGDEALVMELGQAYTDSGGDCAPLGPLYGFPAGALIEVPSPVNPWTAPLHPELR